MLSSTLKCVGLLIACTSVFLKCHKHSEIREELRFMNVKEKRRREVQVKFNVGSFHNKRVSEVCIVVVKDDMQSEISTAHDDLHEKP